MALTKKQRNELFTAVGLSGINATEFDFRYNDDALPVSFTAYAWRGVNEASESWFLTIAHMSSESTFRLYLLDPDLSRGQEFRVHRKIGTDPLRGESLNKWPDVVGLAAIWARDLKEYIDTPDLWEEIRAQRDILADASLESSENTPFTTAEQAEISAQLREAKNYIKENADLTTEQLARIEARIDEAEAASKRLGRKDWWLLFLGTTVQLFYTDLVPSTAVRHITLMVLQGLGHLFGIGGGLPPIAG